MADVLRHPKRWRDLSLVANAIATEAAPLDAMAANDSLRGLNDVASKYHFVDLRQHFSDHRRSFRAKSMDAYLQRARELADFDVDGLWDCLRTSDGDMMVYSPETNEFVVFNEEKELILTYIGVTERDARRLWEKEGCQAP